MYNMYILNPLYYGNQYDPTRPTYVILTSYDLSCT